MKVAIPLFGTRVSPRFDGGDALLVAEIGDGTIAAGEQLGDTSANPLQRVARLRDLGVDTVVCGAVTGFVRRHLEANGIRVCPCVCCEAGDALTALARGELPLTLPCRRGPGRCRGRRGWGRGARRPRT